MPDICLVVPCFNEALRLPAAVFSAWLDGDRRCSFCFVNDGSRDATGTVLERLQKAYPQRIEVVTLEHNRGKAEAVRAGVNHALSRGGFDYIGYWDADLATPLGEVIRFAEVLARRQQCHLALGSRVKRLGAVVERSGVRHFTGRIFATMASLALDLPAYDTQCGAKLIRATVARELFAEPFVTRWLFDLELLARLRQNRPHLQQGLAVEVPVEEWRDVRGSKLRLAEMLKSPIDLLRIQRRYGSTPHHSQ